MKRILIFLTAALFLPVPARAASVHVGDMSEATKFGFITDYDTQRVYYEAAPGERNRVTVAVAEDETSITVTDPGATIEVGRNCERIDAHSARCATPGGPDTPYLSSTEARLGDGDDEARWAGGVGRLVALGGPGDDLLDGGPGEDLLDGGGGKDRLLGGDGPDVLVDGDRSGARGAAGPGRDVLRGGGGDADVLAYTNRTRPVRVDLLERHAGERGERDLTSGFEGAAGGDGSDRIAGTGEDNKLYGNGGADVILGRGNTAVGQGYAGDWLEGGSGRDRLAAGTGSDTVTPGPGRDSVSCGPVREEPAEFDQVLHPGPADRLAPGCDRVLFDFRGGVGYQSLLTAYPVAASSRTLTFDLRCAYEDVSRAACDTPVLLREASGAHRLLGKGRLKSAPIVDGTGPPDKLERVVLTGLGRHLIARRHGVLTRVSLPKYFPAPIAWTIRLGG
jgi:Ca2+-binding RTX toxin-like protein